MIRTVFCLMCLATPLAAQDQEVLCQTSAEIAGLAVAERVAGNAQDKAIAVITADLTDDKAGFAGAVEPIVGWVYTLPEEQLTDEVAVAYETACRGQ